MDIEIPYTDVELVPYINTEVPSEVSIDHIDSKALDITFDNNEYSIVGDDMVIVTKYDDAPQWLKDTIDNIVSVKTAIAVGDLNEVTSALDIMLSELEVAKNTYQLSIISSDDINQRILTAITTLNSSLQEADATILQIAQTATTPEEASAIAINTLSASLSSNGQIGSAIHNLQVAMADLNSTTAESLSYLESTMEGEITGNAQSMHVIRTYVGIDDNGIGNGTGLLSDVAILQKQNDGVIETVTGTYDVMINPQDPNLAELVLTAEPYKTWKAADVAGMDTRLKHIGDVYIKYSVTSNGARAYVGSYKFIRTIVDASDAHKSTDADGFTWALIVDQAAQDAYNQALNAYDLADNKRRVFTTTPYGPYDIGDLWTKTVSGGSTLYKATVKRVSGYVAGDWVVADDAGLNTFVSATYTPTVTSLQNQVDGKVESWYTLSTSDPKAAWTDAATRAKHDGDLWYQTNTFLSYWYSSATHSWNLIEDKAARDALENAATAQATADGKISSYYMATLASAQSMSTAWTALEKTNNVGDLVVVWNDSTLDNNGTWRWNGTSWETTRDKKLVSLASDVTTLRTDLNSGTGTWVTGDAQVVSNLTAVIEGTKATIESQWKYDSNLTLDGITYSTGFGLATSLTNGSGLPVGQSEFWIKADKFKLMSADGSKKSSYSPFVVDAGTGDITFNGRVAFSNVTGYTPPDVSGDISENNDVFAQKLGYASYSDMINAANNGQTIINGGYIRTGLIQSDQIIAGGIKANTVIGNTISGSTITGSKIYGAQIEGSIIKASYIDLTSTVTLTNWQQYTPANYPSQYASNFAHNNDGSLVVDSLGYVRLMGNTSIVTPAVFQTAGSTYTRRDLTPYSIGYCSHGDYKNNNINRCITPYPYVNISTSKKIKYLYLVNFVQYNTTHSCYALVNIHEDVYELNVSVYQGSSSGTELSSGSIKKNGSVIQSFLNIHGTTNVSTTNVSGGIPITINVGCVLGMFGGMSGSISVESTNVLSTTTQVAYYGTYNIPFKLIQGYTTYGATGMCEIDIPAITING